MGGHSLFRLTQKGEILVVSMNISLSHSTTLNIRTIMILQCKCKTQNLLNGRLTFMFVFKSKSKFHLI